MNRISEQEFVFAMGFLSRCPQRFHNGTKDTQVLIRVYNFTFHEQRRIRKQFAKTKDFPASRRGSVMLTLIKTVFSRVFKYFRKAFKFNSKQWHVKITNVFR